MKPTELYIVNYATAEYTTHDIMHYRMRDNITIEYDGGIIEFPGTGFKKSLYYTDKAIFTTIGEAIEFREHIKTNPKSKNFEKSFKKKQ